MAGTSVCLGCKNNIQTECDKKRVVTLKIYDYWNKGTFNKILKHGSIHEDLKAAEAAAKEWIETHTRYSYEEAVAKQGYRIKISDDPFFVAAEKK